MEINYFENKEKLIELLEKGKVKIKELQEILVKEKDKLLSVVASKREAKALLSIDFNDSLKLIDIEKEESAELNENTLKDYCDQYKTYYINRLQQIYNNLKLFNELNLSKLIQSSLYLPVYNAANNLNNSLKRDSVYDLYEYFKYDRRN